MTTTEEIMELLKPVGWDAPALDENGDPMVVSEHEMTSVSEQVERDDEAAIEQAIEDAERERIHRGWF